MVEQSSSQSQEEREEARMEAQQLKNEGNALYKAGKVEEACVKYTLGLRVCPWESKEDRAVLYANRSPQASYTG